MARHIYSDTTTAEDTTDFRLSTHCDVTDLAKVATPHVCPLDSAEVERLVTATPAEPRAPVKQLNNKIKSNLMLPVWFGVC